MSPQHPAYLTPINRLPGFRAGWIPRIPDLPIHGGRDQAMGTLRPLHEAAIQQFGGTPATWWRAEQVHGSDVALVPEAPTLTAPDGLPVVPGADGLITATPGIVLAIYVADCGAIWLADPVKRAIGLLHSGKKGTAANILARGLSAMQHHFGCDPADVTAVLGPCIRPPDYDVDFASEIAAQAQISGIGSFLDCGENTASDLSRHYSYRVEKGTTGRMMALLTLDPARQSTGG
jgi:copper oxidase (laccase) domain-containing protein